MLRESLLLMAACAALVHGGPNGICVTLQSLQLIAESGLLGEGQAEALWEVLSEQPGVIQCEFDPSNTHGNLAARKS